MHFSCVCRCAIALLVQAAALPCEAGTYSSASNLTSVSECTAVDAGSFASTGSTTQTACAAGTYTATGEQGACTPCGAGTYQEDEGQTRCDACEPGSYCPAGASAALKCEARTHQDEMGQASCKPCPEGHACEAGATNTTECKAGSRVSDAKDMCELCQAGKYQDKARQDICKICPRGAFCVVGSKHPTNCSIATAAPDEGMGLCTTCNSGSYEDEEGSSRCKPCPNGYYCPRGSATPIPIACDPGTYAFGNVTRPGECLPCPPGRSCAGGQAQPSTCSAGTIAPSNSTVVCRKCDPGKFQSREGSIECNECDRGYFCPRGAATPIPCEGGTFGNANNLASAAECTPVAPDWWAPTGAPLPERCFPGFRCPGRVFDTTNKPPGSKPILVALGGATRKVVVETMTQELELDATTDDYDETQMRVVLAHRTGIPAELISLSVRGGSLIVTLSITTKAAPSDASPLRAMSDLHSRLAGVDYAAVSNDLNMNLTALASPHVQNQTMQIEETCVRQWDLLNPRPCRARVGALIRQKNSSARSNPVLTAARQLVHVRFDCQMRARLLQPDIEQLERPGVPPLPRRVNNTARCRLSQRVHVQTRLLRRRRHG